MRFTFLTISVFLAFGCAKSEVAEPQRKQLTKAGNTTDPKSRVEKAIRDEIKKPEGNLTETDLGQVKSLYLADVDVTDGELKELVSLQNLTVLGLSGSQVTDNGFKTLSKLQQLTYLDLQGTQISDEKG